MKSTLFIFAVVCLTFARPDSYFSEEQFEGYDRDVDGALNQKEWDTVMQSDRVMQFYSFQDAITAFDTNGDILIDIGEFLTMVQRVETVETNSRYEEFNMTDTDANGYISGQEAYQYLRDVGEKFNRDEVDEMIRAGDTDKDGYINFQEFYQ
jgi:Ca2+-binding EF-hand superfamily protein